MATHFVIYEGKAVSKHKSIEVANKKRDAWERNSGFTKPSRYARAIFLGYAKVNVISCEKGSTEYEKHMEQLAFNKEEREKYNVAYKRANPEGYQEFLEKREARFKRV